MMNPPITDRGHAERYLEFLILDRTSNYDNERRALLYLLSSDLLYDWARSLYDFQAHGTRNEWLRDCCPLSGGEYRLALLAYHLYSDSNQVSILDVITTLDAKNFDLAVKSLYVRRGVSPPNGLF